MLIENLETLLTNLGIPCGHTRVLLALPIVEVFTADKEPPLRTKVAIEQFLDERLHFADEKLEIVRTWLKDRPSSEYLRDGLKLLEAHQLAQDVVLLEGDSISAVLQFCERELGVAERFGNPTEAGWRAIRRLQSRFGSHTLPPRQTAPSVAKWAS